MSWKPLRVQTFVVAATLSIAMLLFAAQRRDGSGGTQFRSVLDLTRASAPGTAMSSRDTELIAPAKLGGAWTVDAIPPARLIGPLVVIEAGHKNFPDSESLVTMDDVASYERINGPVPRGAIVFLTSRKLNTAPRFSDDALQFLGEARDIVGVGGVGTQIFSSAGESYVARKGIYELANVTNVSLLPRSGGIALAAPQKVVGANEEPVRLMALLR